MKELRQGGDRLGPVSDDFYAALMDAHEGLSFDESVKLNARLILLMANDIGDMERLVRLIESAGSSR